MEQILGKNCNQIFSGAPYRVQKDQGHLIASVFGIRGTVPGTKSSGALWILLTHPNSGHGRETQNIGWIVSLMTFTECSDADDRVRAWMIAHLRLQILAQILLWTYSTIP